MPHTLKKTHAAILVRQDKAMDLRVLGVSYRKIGEHLGVSGKTAYIDVQASLGRLDSVTAEKAERLRDIELARLDLMMFRLGTAANAGDTKAINTQVRIVECRAKLLGLNAPVKVNADVSSGDGKPIVFTMHFDNDKGL